MRAEKGQGWMCESDKALRCPAGLLFVPAPLSGERSKCLIVQTDSRENRDPRTVWELEKDVRCELTVWEAPVSDPLPNRAQLGLCADAPGLSVASPPEDVRHTEACPALPSSVTNPQAFWT